MNIITPIGPTPARLRAFALGSAILHGLVLAGWQTSPWLAGHVASALSVTLEPGQAQAASAEIRPAEQFSHHTAGEQTHGTPEDNNRHAPAPLDQASFLIAKSHQRENATASSQGVARDEPQDPQNPATPSVPAAGEEVARDQAMAQIRARLNTDLARYFDYPYAARLRGWEGRVLLAFHIEPDGRLENIRVARSSGFAVLDDAALGSLHRVERLAEAVAWLRGSPLAMQIPVIYRLRCFGNQACREVMVAAGGYEGEGR